MVTDEAQRTLSYDDVAALRYAMTGVDEVANTGDDYTLTLVYAGLTTDAEIVLDFDNSQTGFAVTSLTGQYIGGSDHIQTTSATIYINDTFNWFFNDQLTTGGGGGGGSGNKGLGSILPLLLE